jgi:hypothetical protein
MRDQKRMSAREIEQFVKNKMDGLNRDERAWFLDELKRSARTRRKEAMKVLAELQSNKDLSLEKKRGLVGKFERLEEKAQRIEERIAAFTAVKFNFVDSKGKKIEEV